jgi:hypothetical protein
MIRAKTCYSKFAHKINAGQKLQIKKKKVEPTRSKQN